MDIKRPQRSTSNPTTTSELFICFTSRLSNSSSMRISSKSILSPGRTAEKSTQSLSLSTSLSRRLRHNGSLRGAQSPAMLKTRGSSAFSENPEPSSPKVTCIGQVRVKTKKQSKKMKMRACRSKRLSGGEASFRRIEHNTHEGLIQQNSQGVQNQTQDCSFTHRNQRWVHLPLTICEGLRAFGAEFSCLLPCKSSCFSSSSHGREKSDKGDERESSGSSCGAVFRWLVALHEGEDEEKRRDIELVVGEEEDEESRERVIMERGCSRRRSIFDDMEFDEMFGDVNNSGNYRSSDNKGGEEEEEEEGGRVSICIPPKNALLLMRCRSDPMRMASLSHKLWEPQLPQDEDEDDDDEEEEREDGVKEVKEEEALKMEEKTEDFSEEIEKLDGYEVIDEICDNKENVKDLPVSATEDKEHSNQEEEKEEDEEEEEEEQETEEKQVIENTGETEEQEAETTEDTQLVEDENPSIEVSSIETTTVEDKVEDGDNDEDLVTHSESQVEEEREREESSGSDLCSSTTSSSSSEESTAEEKDPVEKNNEPPLEDQKATKETQNEKPMLPDCLLLMMCEPKLSMEVSKETWVCSTDFIRWLPERHHKKKATKTDGSDESINKKKKPGEPVPQPPARPPVQPARSSISFPAGGGSVANLIEEKLIKAGGGVGYEPFVLTRCKSAPMRSTAKIAPPELACSLWGRENGRKLEPHRPATFGVGAAGVGF